MKRAWFLCAVLALLVGIFAASRFTPAASAQDDKPSIKEGETSIEVRVKADTALPAAATNKTDAGVEASADATTIVVSGSTVTISGTTAVDGKQMNVKLTVTPPDGEAQELNALADAKGDFAAKFTATIAEGDYQVEAVSPDGKGNAQTTLRVLLPAAVIDETVTEATDLLSAASEAEETAEELVAKLPTSPPQVELLSKLDQLKPKLAEAPEQLAKLKEAWAQIEKITQKYPQTLPALRPLLNGVAAWKTKAEGQSAKVREQLEKSKRAGVRCDQLDAATQAFNAASFILNFVGGGPLDLINTYVKDNAVPTAMKALIPAKYYKSDTEFFISESWKAARAIVNGPSAWFGAVLGLAVDVAAFSAQKTFSRYCEKFQGPLEATFHAEFYTHGELYWKYDIDLEGKLELRYAKSGHPGEAVHFTGQFEGNGTRFTLWENFTALFPDFEGNVTAHRAIPAVGFPYIESAGQLVRTEVTPSYFNIPVEGEIVKDKVTIKMKDEAKADFSELVKGRVFYVFTLLISPIIEMDAPYQKAYFILSRSIRQKSEYTITVDPKTKVSMFKQDFAREEKDPDGEFVVRWKTKVKACNPNCP